MAANEIALFVFAHQDDEMAAASRIAFEVTHGSSVYCVFLTDGSGGRHPAAVRDAESLSVLSSLGVPADQVRFIGSQIPIADGSLVLHLDLALESIEREMRSVQVSTVYCLAFEGGHQDHDASHLVAAAFAQNRGVLDRCLEVPLYRGMGSRGPFFRVFSPLDVRTWERRRLGWLEGFRLLKLIGRYGSQRRSWLGLFPEAFLKLGIMRRELVRRVDPSRFMTPSPARSLFYERRFHFPREHFDRASASFVKRHFAFRSASAG